MGCLLSSGRFHCELLPATQVARWLHPRGALYHFPLPPRPALASAVSFYHGEGQHACNDALAIAKARSACRAKERDLARQEKLKAQLDEWFEWARCISICAFLG